MSVHNGAEYPIADEVDGLLALDISRSVVSDSAQPVLDHQDATFGVRSLVDTSRVDAGYSTPCFGVSHIYERMWLTPASIDAGFIVEDKQYSLYLWNAYRYQTITLNDIIGDAVSGTSIAKGTLPIDLTAWEEKEYILTVLKSGPPVLNGTYTFDADVQDCVLTLVGLRVIPFTYEHNWASKFALSYNFNTLILQSQKLYEQRRQYYSKPRRDLSINVLEVDSLAERLKNDLRYGQDKVFAVPVYSELSNIDEVGSLQGMTTINTKETLTSYWNLNNNTQFVMLLDLLTCEGEVKEIGTVGASSLTFAHTITMDLQAAHTVAYPCVVCYLDRKRFKAPTASVVEAVLDFKEYIRGE